MNLTKPELVKENERLDNLICNLQDSLNSLLEHSDLYLRIKTLEERISQLENKINSEDNQYI
jgi:predicted nuclease with TOPRIM domain